MSAATVDGPFSGEHQDPSWGRSHLVKWSEVPETLLASLQYSALLHILAASAEACHALQSSFYFREDGV